MESISISKFKSYGTGEAVRKEKLILTVSQLTKDIKLVLESTFGYVWVEGEVSNVRQPSSGHIYCTLKDANAQIRCVFFRQQSAGLRFQLQDGLQVIIFARVSVYERDGQYQLYINSIEPKGKGSLQLAFEQLKERLAKEGLFAEELKKPLPFLPQTIGIITSPTGAVIQDMLHILKKRFENFVPRSIRSRYRARAPRRKSQKRCVILMKRIASM